MKHKRFLVSSHFDLASLVCMQYPAFTKEIYSYIKNLGG